MSTAHARKKPVQDELKAAQAHLLVQHIAADQMRPFQVKGGTLSRQLGIPYEWRDCSNFLTLEEAVSLAERWKPLFDAVVIECQGFVIHPHDIKKVTNVY